MRRTLDAFESTETKTCPWNTPWGRADQRDEVAPGIWSVSTSSHGGYWLRADRAAELKAAFPSFAPWAGYHWFEEDCDWALVVVCFPGAFDKRSIYHAVRIVDMMTDRKPEYFGIDKTESASIKLSLARGCIEGYTPQD